MNQALRPYLLNGKFSCLFCTLVITFVFWWIVSLLLTALVNFVLKKVALLDEFLWRFPANVVLYFRFNIVRFLAMFFLTVLILASLAALPEDALAFLSVLN